MPALQLLQRLQQIDRRIIYLALVTVLSLPFFVEYALPVYPDTCTRQTFDTLERLFADPATRSKIVFVISNWGPGTSGENGPQFEVLLRHVLRRRMKFIFLTTADDPIFIESAQLGVQRAIAAEQRRALAAGLPLPQWTYGVDYLNLGMLPAPVFASIADTLLTRTLSLVPTDYVLRRALTPENFPLLENFRGPQDIALVLVISAGDEAADVCGIVQSQLPTLKVATATMGIVATDLYALVRSGQLCGLINSARGAAEYLSLIDPGAPTMPLENSMSLGKLLLLLLVLLGNAAFLLTRHLQRIGRLPPAELPRRPLTPLPRRLTLALFAILITGYAGGAAFEVFQTAHYGVVRQRLPRPGDDPTARYAAYERVSLQALQLQTRQTTSDSIRTAALARRDFARLLEARIGEFVAAILTLGVLAFLIGDNRFYRVTEAIIIGSGMAYFLVEKWDKVLRPLWVEPIVAAATGAGPRIGLLWLLLLLPGSLWYFVYAKRLRWLNQVIVALFVGFAIGPEFQKQVGLMVPQIIDTIRPVWPLTISADGRLMLDPVRLEHLIFVTVLVLCLCYFIFFFRPRSRAGTGLLTAGRLALMIGFGALFGNTVNTRLAWLAPRIGFIWQDWIGKLFAT
jgi:hypothetical protein